ncbi:MAG: chromate transporter [Kiritimatiellae bacterium]|nr:chromate transporter [Kiritimatiellia bacterium]
MIYLTLFLTFFKIGLFTIGGGYAMIPLIQTEVITRHGWMTLDQFTEFVGIAESTPGPFAINISTFCGMTTAGLPGSLCATLGVVLPSVLIILAIAKIADRILHHWVLQSALKGARPAVIGLIGAAATTLFSHALIAPNGHIQFMQAGLTLLLFMLAHLFKLSAILLILCGAGLGLLVQLCNSFC